MYAKGICFENDLVLHVNVVQEEFFNLANAAIKNYTEEIVDAINHGYEGEPMNNNNQTHIYYVPQENVSVSWSFSGAFLYSLTVITTIGKNYM
jgi:hypothetical protein